jgi:DNA-binding Lrp family transcriptional regulator
MQEEKLLLTRRERDRLKVLHEVRKGHIPQRQAAEELKLSERWIRKLVRRIEKKGDRAVVHGLRGLVSTHRISEKVEKRAVELVGREYADFGPTLASEYLARDHHVTVSRETLRQWMVRAGLWKRRKQRIEEIHMWRRRRSCFGELVQWDTSEHDWLEGRGEKMYLIAMIDDATSRALARFAFHDSTAENMRLLWAWLERYGRFVDAYTDRAGLFETNRPQQREEERDGKLPETQIGRALRELGIGWIAARSPQAKGRIERFFETAQDRLVKGMRKAKVCGLDQANAYLEQHYLPLWKERFTVQPANPVDAHRPLGKDHPLTSILSHVEKRVIGKDYTLRYGRQLYQVAREQIRPRLRGQAVRIEQRLSADLVVRGPEGELKITPCEVAGKVAVPRRPSSPRPPTTAHWEGRRRWLYGFHLADGPSLEQIVATAYGNTEEETPHR